MGEALGWESSGSQIPAAKAQRLISGTIPPRSTTSSTKSIRVAWLWKRKSMRTGDGLLLVDTNSSVQQTSMKVEAVSGSTARDLGILKTADSIGGNIDGSYEKTIDLELTDTLEEVIAKINDADIDADASLLDTGSGAAPYRLVLSSSISGRDGDLVVDTGRGDLGFTELTQARNAKVFIGEGANAVLVERHF